MIEEDYVSFETAKLLKEKGFNESTNSQYPVYGIHYGEVGEYNITDRSRNPENYIPAPTLQMAMKWLREAHSIDISVTPDRKAGYSVLMFKDKRLPFDTLDSYSIYEQACETAIKYSLENLI